MANDRFTIGDYIYTFNTSYITQHVTIADGNSGFITPTYTPITNETEFNPYIYVNIFNGEDEHELYLFYGKAESGWIYSGGTQDTYYDYNGGRYIFFQTNYRGDGATRSISVSYEYYNGGGVNARVADKTKSSYTALPTSVTYNGTTYAVTGARECYSDCINLVNAPDIPSSITEVSYCFNNCPKLTGNIVVNNVPNGTQYQVFSAGGYDKYIINGTGASNIATAWRAICSDYSKVHYEADDNPDPSLTLSVKRVNSTGYDDPDNVYVKIEATIVRSTNRLPVGWSSSLTTNKVTKDTDTTDLISGWSTSGTTTSGSINAYDLTEPGDPSAGTSQHSFKLSSIITIIDSNNTIKRTISKDVSEILAAVFATIDFYPGGKGIAFGAYAKSEGFVLEMDTMINKDAGVYVDPNAGTGTEDRKLQTAITNLSWGTILQNGYLDIKKSLNKIIQAIKSIVDYSNDPPIIGVSFSEVLDGNSSGGGTIYSHINIPNGYAVVPNCRPVSLYISGYAKAYITDRGVVEVHESVSNYVHFSYYLWNPDNYQGNLTAAATILCYRIGMTL